MYKTLFLLLTASFVFGSQNWVMPPTTLGTVVSEEDLSAAVVIDGEENATAAWFGIISTVFVSRSLGNTATWSAPFFIGQAECNSGGVGLAANLAGDATVVWVADIPLMLDRVHASRFSIATNTWSAEMTIASELRSVRFPQVAMDPAGNAIAGWPVSLAMLNTFHAQASRYTNTSMTWQSPETISAFGQGLFVGTPVPFLSMDDQGNGVAVWKIILPPTPIRIQAARYDVLTDTWSMPVTLSNFAFTSFFPDVSMDPFGNAIAVWTGFDGFNFVIQASRYTVATNTWSAPVIISTVEVIPNRDAEDPHIDSDNEGNMIAVWTKNTGTVNETQSSRFDIQTGLWQTIPTRVSNASQNTKLPKISVNGSGNAIAIYATRDVFSNRVFAACFNASTLTWDDPIELSDTDLSVEDNGVALGPNNGAAAVWTSRVPGIIQATRGIAPPPLPPRNLRVTTERVQFPCEAKTTCVLTWKKSLSSDVVSYRVLRNGTVIGRVKAGCPLFFVDSNPPKKRELTYSVIAVDRNGAKSEAISTTKTILCNR